MTKPDIAVILEKIDGVKEDLHDIEKQLETINRLLFIGNGQKSVMVRLESNEIQLENIIWFKRVSIIAALTGVVSLIVTGFSL